MGKHLCCITCGLLVAFFGTVKKAIVNHVIERKYPISGVYLTRFEDLVNGIKVTQTAIATLNQKGKKVYGKTSLLNANKVWIIEGEITNAGHLHGIYTSENPHDKGIGNFFLFINHQKHMDGLWSGYDSINQRITSGSYTFEPIMDNLIIRDISETDIPAVLNIVNLELGKDYLTEALINDYKNNRGQYVFKIAAFAGKRSTKAPEIIGFCFAIITETKVLERYIALKDLSKFFGFTSQVGIVKTVAIKQNFKGKGVGTSLIRATLEDLETEHGLRCFCSIGWKSGDKINIHSILSQFNFTFLKEIPNYWQEDSLKYRYSCPECGDPPCKCPAIIYTRFI